jgi:uncharacterized protein with PIN domain
MVYTLDIIEVGVDDTDHMVFFCPKCSNELMKVKSVYTKKEPDKCTIISLICPVCKTTGMRKFYWVGKLSEQEYKRTHKKKKWFEKQLAIR